MAYTQKLKKFFMQHDPDRMYLAKKISRAFRNDEDAVMKRLEEIYSAGGPKKLTYKTLDKPTKKLVKNTEEQANEETTLISEQNIEVPVKKKGMLKKIIIVVLATAFLGGGGYFGYSMFMGANHDESHSEATHDDSHSNDEHDNHSEASHDDSHSNDEHDNHSEASHDDHDDHSEKASKAVSDSLIDDVESKIEQAEKDSTMEDIKDAAEALHVIGL